MSTQMLFSLGANASDIGLQVGTAQHYIPVDGEKPSSLSVYFVDSSVSTSSALSDAKAAYPNYDLRTYTLVSDTINNKAYLAPASTGPAPVVQVVQIDIEPEFDEDFNAWYEDEHIGLTSQVPGWVRCRRYVLDKYVAEEPTKYLTLHEWTRVVSDDEPVFLKTGQTEWSDRIVPRFTKFVSRRFRLTAEAN